MTERLFQQIWAGLYFQTQGLQTTEGKDVEIIHQGTPNRGDGPDFKNASIRIGGITMHGDVELHLHPSDWLRHGHQKDSRYNQVILHVALAIRSETDRQPTCLPDGTIAPCLILQPYIPSKLDDVLSYAGEQQEMVCSGMLHLISPEVVERQIEKAHQEYFDYRVDHLMKYYDPALPPSQAWLKMLITGLFDGLGVSQNSVPMVNLCRLMYIHLHGNESAGAMLDAANQLSGLQGFSGGMSKTDWDYSASRPANQPKARITQGAALFFAQYQIPFSHWLNAVEPKNPWEYLLQHCYGLGLQKNNILFATVYLPSLHILGNLFHYKELTSISYSAWRQFNTTLPPPILRSYEKNGFPEGKFKRKLGAVFQYKHLCRNSCCDRCFVMQNLLQA